MSRLLSFVFGQDFPVIGGLISCAFVVASFALVVRKVKWRPTTHTIMKEIQFWRTIVKWFVKTFPKGITNLEELFDIFDAVQPTPYRARSSLIRRLMYIDKPEDLQIILNHSNALEKPDVYHFFPPTIADSMTGVPVPEWKWRRRNAVPFFNTDKLEMYSHDMYKQSQLELEKLQAWADTDEELDIFNFMSGLSFKITMETLMGIQAEKIYTESEVQRKMHDIQCMDERFMERVLHVWLHPNIVYAVVKKFNGFSEVLKRSNEFLKDVIRNRRKTVIEETEKGQNETYVRLLDGLSTSFLERDGHDMSPALINEVGSMYTAGTYTSAVSDCYTVLMLAMNQNIQDQLCAEIDQVLGTKEDENPITLELLEDMPVLDRCIKETLRLFPALPIYTRRVTSTMKLSDGEVAEKDTDVLVSVYNLHRKPELYDNPLMYDPDHFLPENVQKRHPYSFLPFSAGPRGCLGYKYAMITIKITLATILRKYRFTTDMKMEDVKSKLGLVLQSANGWKVKIHSRR